jgi:hypothetical protein
MPFLGIHGPLLSEPPSEHCSYCCEYGHQADDCPNAPYDEIRNVEDAMEACDGMGV